MRQILLLFALLFSTFFAFSQTDRDVPVGIKFYQLHGRSSGTSLIGNTFFEIHYEIENKKTDTLRNGQLEMRILPGLSAKYFEILEPANATIRDSVGLTFIYFNDKIILPNQSAKLIMKVNLDQMVRKDELATDYIFRNQFFQFTGDQGDLIKPDSVWPQRLGTYINYLNSNVALSQDDTDATEIDPNKPLTVDFSFRNRSGYDFDTLRLDLDIKSDISIKNVDLVSATDSLDVQLNDDELLIFRSDLNNSGNDFFSIVLDLHFEESEVQENDQFELFINGYTADYQFFHQFNEKQFQLDFLRNTSSTKDFSIDEIQLSYAPNPSASVINFEVKNEITTKFQFEVFDLIGRRNLSKQVGSTFQITKSELGSGIWFFVLKKEGRIADTGKVIFVE